MDLEDVAHAATTFDQRDHQLQDMLLDNGRYKCTHCDRTYVTKGGVVRHLKKVHGVDLDLDTVRATTTEEVTSARAIVASFSRMAFLYRDTSDSYRMADGDRIFRNAKLEMLYAYSLKHTKYRLWLWRMLSYELAILSPCEAFDYKWNTCTNLQGGIGRNIPNDNAVELQVGEIKKRLQREGSNKSFESAQLICKTNQIIAQITKNLQKVNASQVRSRQRAAVSKLKDIKTLVEEILEAKVLESDTKYGSFVNYKDPLARLPMAEFHKWVNVQKDIAALKMVRNAHL